MIARAAGGLFSDARVVDYGQPDAEGALRCFDEFPWAEQLAEWTAADEHAVPMTPSVTFRIDDGHLDIQASPEPGTHDVEICLRREAKLLGLIARNTFDTAKAVPAADVRALIGAFFADVSPAEKRGQLRALVPGLRESRA